MQVRDLRRLAVLGGAVALLVSGRALGADPVVVPLPLAKPAPAAAAPPAAELPLQLRPGQRAPKMEIEEPKRARRLAGWYLAFQELATADIGQGYYDTFARDRSEVRLILLVAADETILDAQVRSPRKYEVEVPAYDCVLLGGLQPANVYLNLNADAYRVLVAEDGRLIEKAFSRQGPLRCDSGSSNE